MSIGSIPEEESSEIEEIHSVYTCPACEFSSMRKTIMAEMVAPLVDDKIEFIDVRVCRGCGYIERIR